VTSDMRVNPSLNGLSEMLLDIMFKECLEKFGNICYTDASVTSYGRLLSGIRSVLIMRRFVFSMNLRV
jgi:hypothetical protein